MIQVLCCCSFWYWRKREFYQHKAHTTTVIVMTKKTLVSLKPGGSSRTAGNCLRRSWSYPLHMTLNPFSWTSDCSNLYCSI